MNNLQSIYFFFPEIILTLVILVAIVYDLFLKIEDSGKVCWVLVFGLIAVAMSIGFQDNRTTTLFTNAVVLDPFSKFFKMIIILSTILVSIVSLSNDELLKYR